MLAFAIYETELLLIVLAAEIADATVLCCEAVQLV